MDVHVPIVLGHFHLAQAPGRAPHVQRAQQRHGIARVLSPSRHRSREEHHPAARTESEAGHADILDGKSPFFPTPTCTACASASSPSLLIHRFRGTR